MTPKVVFHDLPTQVDSMATKPLLMGTQTLTNNGLGHLRDQADLLLFEPTQANQSWANESAHHFTSAHKLSCGKANSRAWDAWQLLSHATKRPPKTPKTQKSHVRRLPSAANCEWGSPCNIKVSIITHKNQDKKLPSFSSWFSDVVGVRTFCENQQRENSLFSLQFVNPHRSPKIDNWITSITQKHVVWIPHVPPIHENWQHKTWIHPFAIHLRERKKKMSGSVNPFEKFPSFQPQHASSRSCSRPCVALGSCVVVVF